MRGSRRFVLAALPCLLGNSSLDPGSCPVLGPEAFDVTIASVEHATYTCAVEKSEPQGGVLHRCVSVYSGGCTFTLRGSDGSERTATSSADPAIGGGWCDVPAGHYDITLCTRLGPLPCSVDVAEDDHQVLVGPHSSLPHSRRYRAQTDRPLLDGSHELVFDAGENELAVGARVRVRVHGSNAHVLELGTCDLGAIPAPVLPPAAPGCGRCDGGGFDGSVMGLIAIVLAVPGRRRLR